MLIGQSKFQSQLKKEDILKKLNTLSQRNPIKTEYFGSNKFSFHISGRLCLMRYTPNLRVLGTIEDNVENCLVKYRIFPNLGFWIINAWLFFNAILLLNTIFSGKMHSWITVLMWFVLLVLNVCELITQLQECHSKIGRILED